MISMVPDGVYNDALERNAKLKWELTKNQKIVKDILKHYLDNTKDSTNETESFKVHELTLENNELKQQLKQKTNEHEKDLLEKQELDRQLDKALAERDAFVEKSNMLCLTNINLENDLYDLRNNKSIKPPKPAFKKEACMKNIAKIICEQNTDNIEDIARQLNVSKWTIQRRLEAEKLLPIDIEYIRLLYYTLFGE